MRLLFQECTLRRTIPGLLIVLLVLASPVAAIEIIVTGNLKDWALAPGTTNENADAVELSVSTTSTAWSVSVADALDGGKNSSTAGRMLEYNPGSSAWINEGSVLAENLTIKGESFTGVTGKTVTLGPQENVIETGDAPATNTQMKITLRQPVATTDRHLTNGNIYRVVVTFTATEQ